MYQIQTIFKAQRKIRRTSYTLSANFREIHTIVASYYVDSASNPFTTSAVSLASLLSLFM